MQCIGIFMHWTINHRIQSPNDRSKPFILFSILIYAWRPNFTFFEFFLLFIKPLWKSENLDEQQKFLDHRISNFQSDLINSKKKFKKCKIWSPSTFQYGEQDKRFGSVVWIFKMAKMSHGSPMCYKPWLILAQLYLSIYIYIYREREREVG